MNTPSNQSAADATRYRDATRHAASRVGVPRTPRPIMRAEQAQQDLDAALAALHAPRHAARRELGSVILPGQNPITGQIAVVTPSPQHLHASPESGAETVLDEIGRLIDENRAETTT